MTELCAGGAGFGGGIYLGRWRAVMILQHYNFANEVADDKVV